MRLIDADRLTELIEKIVPQSALELGYLYQIREYIKQMPTVEPQEWISVKDRLPEKSQNCWVTLEYIGSGKRELMELRYYSERKKFNDEKYLKMQGYKFIAWQPITEPSPYKGE